MPTIERRACVRGCGRLTSYASGVCIWCAEEQAIASAAEKDLLPLIIDSLDTCQGVLEDTKRAFKSKQVLMVREHMDALRRALEKRAGVRP